MKILLSSFLVVLFFSCSSSDNDNDVPPPPPPPNTLAIVTVLTVSNITIDSATSGGNVTNDGGGNVSAKGICWGTTTNPTINDSKTTNGSGFGIYTSQLTGLSPNTLYYVRAYATNSEGTAYSSVASFTTEEETIQCGNVLNSGIELRTQAEVDDLGDQGITVINGSVRFLETGVDNPDPIRDLSPLNCLQEVKGPLRIDNTPELLTLNGLENLKYTKGLVLYATNVESLESLSNLETIDGNILISRNHSLTNLNGLNNVTSVLGTVDISSNDEIVDIEGMESLQSVGENLWIFGNPKLQNLEGLNNLVQIGRQLYLSDGAQMVNIDALSTLETTSSIKIENNPLIESISAFSNLTVSSLESLSIKQNDALINLNGLENIITITDFLEVNYNDILENLDELSNLNVINNRIEIKGNNSLKNINGLSNISECEYDITIDDNSSLTNVTGLNGLTSAGRIYFRENNVLTKLSFDNLVTITLDLIIINNDVLLNADGLNNLETIGRNLEITGNDVFSDLDGLSKLTSIGGDLKIRSFGTLSDVCGLQPLFLANGLGGNYDVVIDDFDVTEQDIADGNCSQ